MLCRIRLSRSLAAWGVLLSALAFGETAAAQKLEDGMEALNKQMYRLREQIRPLLSGDVVFDPKVRDHVEALEVEAKSLVYPLFLEARENLEKKPGEIDRLLSILDRDLGFIARYKDKTGDVSKVFANNVRLCAVEVIKQQSARPIVKLNAARILARLAELGQPELADDLIDVIRDPKENDGARYWALRGLRDLLATSFGLELPTLEKPRIVKIATAVTEFLAQKPAIIDATPQDEIEGYRILRREAVRALAQTRLAVVNDKVRPALVLARFTGNDETIQPLPRIDERLDAMIGLLRMRPGKESPGFQVDYAVEQIAHFVSYFGTVANSHREASGLARLRPWKVDAAHVIPTLVAFRGDVKDPYVTEVTGAALKVLQAVVNGRAASADDLTTLSDTKAPNQGVFAGVESAVKPAKPAPLLGEAPPSETGK
jgi:hypothetical protein